MDFVVKDMYVGTETSKTFPYTTNDYVKLTIYNTDTTNVITLTVTELSGVVHTWEVGTEEQLVEKIFNPLTSVVITNANGVKFKYTTDLSIG